MISSLRNFAKTKFAGLLVFIMIIPFVFWGMGGMFSSGNTNNIAKINNNSISTEDFIDYVNKSGIPEKTIRENLEQNIIEEILSGLVSTTLLDLEIKDFDLTISEVTLLKKIKENKNFRDENGVFQRIKYEKFLLENNLSAPGFEQRLKLRELQRNLFDYIGAGTTSPQFLTTKLFKEENQKLEIEFIDLNDFYVNKDDITDKELENFIKDNKDELKIEYLDFSYTIINPKNLIGVDDFNQSFFDKIDQIEMDISNDIEFDTVVENLNLKSVKVQNFKISKESTEVEKKIFELRNSKYDLFENDNEYILFNIINIENREPNLSDIETRKEMVQLVYQKNMYDYNKNLLDNIRNKKFDNDDFLKMSQGLLQNTRLNSIRDNKKFDINAVEILYSLPINSFTLINDEKNNIYLAKIVKYQNEEIDYNSDEFKKYFEKQNSNTKNTLLKSYDLLLNEKYNVVLNQKTIERVKNFFQ